MAQVSLKIGQGSFGACYQYRDAHTLQIRVKKKMQLLDARTSTPSQQHFCSEVLREIATHYALARGATTTIATTTTTMMTTMTAAVERTPTSSHNAAAIEHETRGGDGGNHSADLSKHVRYSPRVQYLANQHVVQVENMPFFRRNLNEYIKETTLLERLEAMPVIFRDIVRGLHVLHKHVTCHGDLSASNILLQIRDEFEPLVPSGSDEQFQQQQKQQQQKHKQQQRHAVEFACLSDFGSVVLEPQPTVVQCCTWWFRAPELCLRKQDQFDMPANTQPFATSTTHRDIPASSLFGPWNDVWSVGALLAFYVLGHNPFQGEQIVALAAQSEQQQEPQEQQQQPQHQHKRQKLCTSSSTGPKAPPRVLVQPIDEWSCRQLLHAPSPFPSFTLSLQRILSDAGYSHEIVQAWTQFHHDVSHTDISERITTDIALKQLNHLVHLHNAPHDPSPSSSPPPPPTTIPTNNNHQHHHPPSIHDAQWRQVSGVQLSERAERHFLQHLPTLLTVLQDGQWMELVPLTVSMYRRWLDRVSQRLLLPDAAVTTNNVNMDTRETQHAMIACIYLAGVHFDKGATVMTRFKLQVWLTLPKLIQVALGVCRDLDFDLVRPTLFGLLSVRQRGTFPSYLQQLVTYLSSEPNFAIASPSLLYNMYVQSFEAASLVPTFMVTPLWLEVAIPCRWSSPTSDNCTASQLKVYVSRLLYWLSRMTLVSNRETVIRHLCSLLYMRAGIWQNDVELCHTIVPAALTSIVQRFNSQEARQLLESLPPPPSPPLPTPTSTTSNS